MVTCSHISWQSFIRLLIWPIYLRLRSLKRLSGTTSRDPIKVTMVTMGSQVKRPRGGTAIRTRRRVRCRRQHRLQLLKSSPSAIILSMDRRWLQPFLQVFIQTWPARSRWLVRHFYPWRLSRLRLQSIELSNLNSKGLAGPMGQLLRLLSTVNWNPIVSSISFPFLDGFHCLSFFVLCVLVHMMNRL